MIPPFSHHRIGKLRATTGDLDPLAARLWLDRVLAGAELDPHGMPRESILCVRSVRAQLWYSRHPGKPLDLRRMLTAAMGHASRPARESVPCNAEAVLFADLPELLACLARDWCCGDAPGQWWWRLLFPALDPGDAVVKGWIENPQHVPTALCRLDQANCAREFLAALPRRSVTRILENVLAMFGLDDLRPESAIGQSSAPPAFDAAPLASAPPPAPWLPWVKVDPLLPPEQRHLLVIAIMLERAPGVLRSPPFIRAWQRGTGEPAAEDALGEWRSPPFIRAWRVWQRGTEEPTDEDPSAAGLPSFQNNQAVTVAAAPAENTSEWTSLTPKIARTAGAEFTLAESTREIPSAQTSAQFRNSGDGVSSALTGVPGRSAGQVPKAELKQASRASELRASLAEPQREVVRTDWGGVFYLVNVALALGLYGDFTRPRHTGLTLLVWDFLTLLGRRMAGSESFADPLWPLLARLSGRCEGEPPACGFEPPTEWRMPAEWLAGFKPAGDWRWASTGGRLRLRHPLGFLILDVPLACEIAILQLEDELQRFGAEFSPVLREDNQTMPAEIADPLTRWVEWLIPCVHARLASAPGVADAAVLNARVLRQRANVEVTADSVTVRFRLAEHPIELRMAGLDRDPGWVPAAGRRIAFQYD